MEDLGETFDEAIRHALADGRLRSWTPSPARRASLGDLPAGTLGWAVDVIDPASRSPIPDLTVAVVALPAGTSAEEVLTASSWDPLAGAHLIARSTGTPRVAVFVRGRSGRAPASTAFARSVFDYVEDEVR